MVSFPERGWLHLPVFFQVAIWQKGFLAQVVENLPLGLLTSIPEILELCFQGGDDVSWKSGRWRWHIKLWPRLCWHVHKWQPSN